MRAIRLLQALLVAGSLAILAAVVAHLARPSRLDEAVDTTRPAATRGHPTPPPAALPAAGDPSILQTAERVQVDRWVGADRRFRVEAPVMEEREKATVLQGGVRITAPGSDGRAYVVTAREMLGEEEWSRIRASGAVHIARDDGLDLTANWVEHLARDEVETAGGDVRFRHEGRLIACERLRYDVRQGEFRLDGAVAALDLDPERGVLLAAAEHARYLRPEGKVELRDEAVLVGDSLAVRADRIDVTLAAKGARAASLSSRDHDVEVELWSAGGEACESPGPSLEAPLRILRTRTLELGFAPGGGLERVTQGTPQTPVEIEGIDPPARRWTLTAATLTVELRSGGKIRGVNATDLAWQTAAVGSDGKPVDRLEAPAMTATFSAAGALAEATFPRGLVVEQTDRRLSGSHARFNKGVLVVDQDPRLVAGGSTLVAERIELRLAQGEIRAAGKVESESTAGEAAPAALSARGERLRFRSDEMETRNGGSLVVYRGNARAWQGNDILQADEIRADKQMAGFEAEGKVSAALGAEPAKRMSIAADRLTQSGREIVLTGSATLESADLRLRAERIRIELGADRRSAERVEASGREVQGERLGVKTYSSRLVHDIAGGKTEIMGDELRPARLVDAQGEHSGDTLTIWRQGDRILLSSGADGVVRSRISAK